MKKVLILTYYFPPLGLGGTQRIAKFVKYLPQVGWQPTVVTVKPIAYWARDESLMMDVKDARVIATESLDPHRLLARLGRTDLQVGGEKRKGLLAAINQKLLPYFLVPDSKVLWHPFALRAIKKIVAEEHFAAMMTTSPPHSVHLLGRVVAKTFRLPWLADFRDGWAGSHIVHEPTHRHYKKNLTWQKRVVHSASAIVSASPGINESLKVGAGTPNKFHVITNGFDPEDFQSADPGDKFTLCYSGTINKFADPEPFLDALVLLKGTQPKLVENLTVQAVGLDTIGGFADMVSRRGLNSIVQVFGHQDHLTAVSFVNKAHALLLIAKARDTDTFIPGKTFEYIGAQKPIFCISNSRYTNELLRDYALAKTIESFDPHKISFALQEFFSTNWNLIDRDVEFVERFNRQFQTKKLAQILDTLT